MKLAAWLRASICLAVFGLLLLEPQPTSAARLEVTGPAGARLIINDQPQGSLPLPEALELAVGRHDIECRLSGFMPLRQTLEVQEDTQVIRLQVRLVPFSRRDAVAYSALLAGLGQHYLDRPRLGWALTALELGGLAVALVADMQMRDHRDDYLILYDTYRNAIREQDIATAKAQADQAYRDMEDAESRRNTAFVVAASAVVVSVLDAWLRFPGVTSGPGELPVQSAGAATGAAHVGWTVRF